MTAGVGFGVTQPWSPVTVSQLACSVTLSRLLNLSDLAALNGDKARTHMHRLLGRINEIWLYNAKHSARLTEMLAAALRVVNNNINE